MPPLPSKPTRVAKAGEGPLYIARLTADGKYLLTGGQDRTVRLWNPHKPDPAAAPPPPTTAASATSDEPLEAALMIKAYGGGHGHEICDLAVAADNSKVASCGGDRAAVVWDVATGALRKLPAHDAAVNACAATADFAVLLTGSYDRTVRAWDLRAHGRAPVQVLEGARDSITSLLVLPCGAIVAGSVDGRVRTYDARAAALIEDDCREPVTCVAASHDGKCVLASCLGSATLRLLERGGGGSGGGGGSAQLAAYRGHAHARYPLRTAFSADDSHVLSCSEDGDVVAWDLVTGAVAARLRRHARPTSAIAAHPGGPAALGYRMLPQLQPGSEAHVHITAVAVFSCHSISKPRQRAEAASAWPWQQRRRRQRLRQW
ncbi:WD40-repeat-containing domain protein [Tribonema minus]|uniref:WD40-repeat-containing domain protein n=1 Tax=Tribonema minus TaxID=303371 RepID=A0A836CAS4_9STRA|nr:WD40-repeat-containing domain protein [Tribonema minus]